MNPGNCIPLNTVIISVILKNLVDTPGGYLNARAPRGYLIGGLSNEGLSNSPVFNFCRFAGHADWRPCVYCLLAERRINIKIINKTPADLLTKMKWKPPVNWM